MKFTYFILGLLVVGITLLVVGVTNPRGVWTDYNYQGVEVFQTAETYGDFKTKLASEDIIILELEALNSGYPVLVQYNIDAPESLNFPLEDKSKLTNTGFHLFAFGIASTIVSLISLILFGLNEE